jgi:two-component system OmpR family response regulator
VSIIDSYISSLRKKIDRVEPPLIHTVRGVGFSLRVAR